MARRRLTLLLTLAVTLTAAQAPATARADCPTPCDSLLCNGPPTAIVTGTISSTSRNTRQLIIEAVVFESGAGPAPALGEAIDFDFNTLPAGPGLAYVHGGLEEGFAELFYLDARGRVQCGGEAARSTAPQGQGITPEELATAVDGEDATCRQAIRAAGYPETNCDDTVGPFGCQTAVTPARPTAGAAGAALLMGACLLLLRRRSRRGGDLRVQAP